MEQQYTNLKGNITSQIAKQGIGNQQPGEIVLCKKKHTLY